MGFIHHGSDPLTADAMAAGVPSLTDSGVEAAVLLSQAYERLRTVLLALSGVSLLRSLRIAEVGEMSGVVAMAGVELAECRRLLGSNALSRADFTAARAEQLQLGLTALADEVERIAKDGHGDLRYAVLDSVRRRLARSTLPAAGMRHFSSVSCSGYSSYLDSIAHHGDGHWHTHAHHDGTGNANSHHPREHAHHPHRADDGGLPLHPGGAPAHGDRPAHSHDAMLVTAHWQAQPAR